MKTAFETLYYYKSSWRKTKGLKKKKLQKNWNSSKSLNRQGITEKLYITISTGKYNKNITKIQQTQILCYCVGFSLFFVLGFYGFQQVRFRLKTFQTIHFFHYSTWIHEHCMVLAPFMSFTRWSWDGFVQIMLLHRLLHLKSSEVLLLQRMWSDSAEWRWQEMATPID